MKDYRPKAIKLIDLCLESYCGICSSDLPDSVTYMNGIDEVETALEDGDTNRAVELAKETAENMLREEGFPV